MYSFYLGCGGNCSRYGYRSDGVYIDGWFGGICGIGYFYYLLCLDCYKRYIVKVEEIRIFVVLKGIKL